MKGGRKKGILRKKGSKEKEGTTEERKAARKARM
jgi:hypothetical protein